MNVYVCIHIHTYTYIMGFTYVYIRSRFFSKIYNLFLQMTTFFSKPMECSIEFSVRWTERRTGPMLS